MVDTLKYFEMEDIKELEKYLQVSINQCKLSATIFC